MSTFDCQIRRQEPADGDALHEVYSQPKVIWGTLMLPFPSRQAWTTRAAEEPHHMTRLVAVADVRVVGNIALIKASATRRRHVAEIAMAVHDDWQGKGIGSKLLAAALDLADNWFNLNRIELTVFADNEAGLQLYKRCGFEIEGTHKNYAFRDGEYADVHTMARVC